MHEILFKNANFVSFKCFKISVFYFSNFEKYWKKKNKIKKKNFQCFNPNLLKVFQGFSVLIFQFQWRNFSDVISILVIPLKKDSDYFQRIHWKKFQKIWFYRVLEIKGKAKRTWLCEVLFQLLFFIVMFNLQFNNHKIKSTKLLQIV